MGERHHDEYVKEANRLAQALFVEHVRGVDAGATASTVIDPDTLDSTRRTF